MCQLTATNVRVPNSINMVGVQPCTELFGGAGGIDSHNLLIFWGSDQVVTAINCHLQVSTVENEFTTSGRIGEHPAAVVESAVVSLGDVEYLVGVLERCRQWWKKSNGSEDGET